MNAKQIRGTMQACRLICFNHACGLNSMVVVSRAGRVRAIESRNKDDQWAVASFIDLKQEAFVEYIPAESSQAEVADACRDLREDAVNTCWNEFGLEVDF